MKSNSYRGRLAPSPTGFMHMGHARTFWTAQQRAREQDGVLVLRNEDLDSDRCREEFVTAMYEDLRWFGFQWQEGPDCGGPHAPYDQSQRMARYRAALQQLQASGFVYPCTCSRKDIRNALSAPHKGDEEPIYPGTCRPKEESGFTFNVSRFTSRIQSQRVNWRFRVPDGKCAAFIDGFYGEQSLFAGSDFGDFVVWRHDDIPAYHLAVVVDDAAMGITEVVRGADLLVSTARQILLFRAFGLEPPEFFHCPLVMDEAGMRLAKRHDALSLRRLRERGELPEKLRHGW